MAHPRLAALTAASFLLCSSALAARIPNIVKYKDSTRPGATGRAGNATITAHALIGKDNVARLEVTSNGVVERVQVRRGGGPVLNAAGSSIDLPGAAQGESIEVQAHVSGVDGSRTGVVSATETVKLRPDLLASHLVAPPKAMVRLPFDVTAVITELNGDTGARATCSLVVDGTEVDRAANIWIDAGGTVTCRFNHAFASAGTKQLSIRVTGVKPGDYDGANNSVSGSIEVVDGVQADYSNANAVEFEFENMTSGEAPWGGSTGWSGGRRVYSGVFAMMSRAIDVANTAISYTETTDGQLLSSSEGLQLILAEREQWDEGVYTDCAAAGTSSSLRIHTCSNWSWENGVRVGSTMFGAGRDAGDVTYHSSGWGLIYWDDPTSVYTYNNSSHQTWGNLRGFGRTVQHYIVLDDGQQAFGVSRTLTMQPYSATIDPPRSCYTTWTGQQACTDSYYSETGRRGY